MPWARTPGTGLPGLVSLLRTIGVSGRDVNTFGTLERDVDAFLEPLLDECEALRLPTEVEASPVREQVRALAILLIEEERRLVSRVTQGLAGDDLAQLVAETVQRLLARVERQGVEERKKLAMVVPHHSLGVEARAAGEATRNATHGRWNMRAAARKGDPRALADAEEMYEEAVKEDGLAPPRTGVSQCRRQSRAAAANAPPPPPPLVLRAGVPLDLGALEVRLEYPHAQLIADGVCPYTLRRVARGRVVVGKLSQAQLADQCAPLAAYIVANIKKPIWPVSGGAVTNVSSQGHLNLLAGDGRCGSDRFFVACAAIAKYCSELAAALSRMEEDQFVYVRLQAYQKSEAGGLHKDKPKLADDENSVAGPLYRFAINLFGDRGFVLSPQVDSWENATVLPRKSGGDFVVMQPEQYINRPEKGLNPLMFHCADVGAGPGLTLVVELRQPNDLAERTRLGDVPTRIRRFGMQCVTAAT
jgi:hypothetical protein